MLVVSWCRYFVTPLMMTDLSVVIRTQTLNNDHIRFLIYQIMRALKVSVLTPPDWRVCVCERCFATTIVFNQCGNLSFDSACNCVGVNPYW